MLDNTSISEPPSLAASVRGMLRELRELRAGRWWLFGLDALLAVVFLRRCLPMMQAVDSLLASFRAGKLVLRDATPVTMVTPRRSARTVTFSPDGMKTRPRVRLLPVRRNPPATARAATLSQAPTTSKDDLRVTMRPAALPRLPASAPQTDSARLFDRSLFEKWAGVPTRNGAQNVPVSY